MTPEAFFLALLDGILRGFVFLAQSLATAVADNPLIALIVGFIVVGVLILRFAPRRRYRR